MDDIQVIVKLQECPVHDFCHDGAAQSEGCAPLEPRQPCAQTWDTKGSGARRRHTRRRGPAAPACSTLIDCTARKVNTPCSMGWERQKQECPFSTCMQTKSPSVADAVTTISFWGSRSNPHSLCIINERTSDQC